MTANEEAARLARDKALQLLAIREHTRHEVATKLRARDFAQQTIEPVLQALEDNGLLSDARATEMYIRQRAAKGFGELKIHAELRNKGIEDAAIRESLAESAIDWIANAQAALEKKFAHAANGDYKLLAKQQRYLSGRGFSSETVRSVVKNNDEVG